MIRPHGAAFTDPMAVVDNRFRVHGIPNLRVIDASSIPVLTNGHPMAVLVAMAERASDFLAEDDLQEQKSGRAGKKKSKDNEAKTAAAHHRKRSSKSG